MKLDPQAREFYRLKITTDPVSLPEAWEASFNEGLNYYPAANLSGWSVWLLAGPDVALGAAVAVITHAITPKVRLIANPEVVVRGAPKVWLDV